ncbi:MAG: hypothetical protein I8H70_02490 [Burkholderiales bacterium]|nr:hypothetical protein [Burkholderiales bacterium]
MPFDRNLLPDTTAYFEDQGLKLSGPRSAKWKTTECRFHDGSDSMRVNTSTGAWVCMSCGKKGGDVLAYELAVTGADFVDAAKAIGAWFDDGKPYTPPKPTPLSPRAALSAMALEATFVAVAAGNVAKGVVLTAADRSRLMMAVGRINLLVGAFA